MQDTQQIWDEVGKLAQVFSFFLSDNRLHVRYFVNWLSVCIDFQKPTSAERQRVCVVATEYRRRVQCHAVRGNTQIETNVKSIARRQLINVVSAETAIMARIHRDVRRDFRYIHN